MASRVVSGVTGTRSSSRVAGSISSGSSGAPDSSRKRSTRAWNIAAPARPQWSGNAGSAQSGAHSSTSWPSDCSRPAAWWAAATHSGSTSSPPGAAVQSRIRSACGGVSAASANDGCGSGGPSGVEGPSPASTSSASAVSCTVRVSTPSTPKPSNARSSGPSGTRKRVGLSPTTPQHDAGMRIEPPASLPCAIGTSPAATAAALPPEDPPVISAGSCGLRAGP